MFETHFHADFVSGHLDLKQKQVLLLYLAPIAKPSYQAIVAEDSQVFNIGLYKVKVIHTPAYNGKHHLFINRWKRKGAWHYFRDTLFIGDVGRPDLAQHVVAELTEEKLASLFI